MRISDWSSDVCSSDLMTLQEVEDLARYVGGEALHHAVRHAHPFAVRSRQADESACRRQRRERAQHLGLLAAHHVGLAGARFVEPAGHDPGLRLALTPVAALEALRALRRLGLAGQGGNT